METNEDEDEPSFLLGSILVFKAQVGRRHDAVTYKTAAETFTYSASLQLITRKHTFQMLLVAKK